MVLASSDSLVIKLLPMPPFYTSLTICLLIGLPVRYQASTTKILLDFPLIDQWITITQSAPIGSPLQLHNSDTLVASSPDQWLRSRFPMKSTNVDPFDSNMGFHQS
jgi:hypothetical protein